MEEGTFGGTEEGGIGDTYVQWGSGAHDETLHRGSEGLKATHSR